MPSIQEVKRKHENAILKIKGVVSVGIGLNKDKQQAIIVGIENNSASLAQKIPKELEGFPVETQVIGKIDAL